MKTTEEEPAERSRGEESSELQERPNVPSEEKKKLEEDQLRAGGPGPAQTPAKKKKNIKRRGAENGLVPSADKETAVTHTPTPAKKKKKKVQEETPQVEEEDNVSMVMAEKKKMKKKLPAAEMEADGEDEATAPPEDQSQGSTSVKTKKKKKIPVVFEFEADELQNLSNGDAEETRAVS